MLKAIRRLFAGLALFVLAFKAVGSFLSWVEKQEDTPSSVWTDDDEFEEAQCDSVQVPTFPAKVLNLTFALTPLSNLGCCLIIY